MRLLFAGTPAAAVPSLEGLIASRHDGFRCCKSIVREEPSGITMDQEVADALGVKAGETVRVVTLKPQPTGGKA